MKTKLKRLLFILQVMIMPLYCVSAAYPADVIIIGDAKLKPVSDVIDGINKALSYKTTVKSPEDVKDNLESAYYREGAKVVVALGQDAVNVSLSLPESIPVIYGLIINPLETARKNITGVYMATPVSEYTSFIDKYFPDIKRVGIICEPETKKIFCSSVSSTNLILYHATNPYEFIAAISELRNNIDALLLLPEKNLISQTTIEKTYLFSFREKIPVIGISEKYVKTGSLFSLGFDTADMGRHIGEVVKTVLSRGRADSPPSPPERFNLYINRRTAETMGINISPKLYDKAERVYP